MQTFEIKESLLTDPQIMRKIIASTKKWIKANGYENRIFFHYVRGMYHFTNCTNYMLSAKDILENATGLEFIYFNASMAKLKK